MKPFNSKKKQRRKKNRVQTETKIKEEVMKKNEIKILRGFVILVYTDVGVISQMR